MQVTSTSPRAQFGSIFCISPELEKIAKQAWAKAPNKRAGRIAYGDVLIRAAVAEGFWTGKKS